MLRRRAPLALLDSYEPERRAFALGLVATVDRVFTVATSTSRRAPFVRTRVVPLVVPFLVRFTAVRRFIFRVLSQTAIRYRTSPLSAGQAGDVRGGDRLPWMELEGVSPRSDSFAALEGRCWQVHLYGSASPGMPSISCGQTDTSRSWTHVRERREQLGGRAIASRCAPSQ